MRSNVPAALLLAIAAFGGCKASDPAPAPELACQRGAWQLDSGERLSITPSGNGMRYRFLDGRIGRLAPGEGGALGALEGWRVHGPQVAHAEFEACDAGRMRFGFGAEAAKAGLRLPLPAEETRFRSGALLLLGRLVMPAAATPAPPLVVLVHGSESWSALEFDSLQYLLPAQGVAVFVYDKRGTGRSEGEYTQDFDLLAGDAIAAMDAARALRPNAFSAVGYVGSSQGGWVAPLAASRSDVDFAVALYGLVESPLAEDREQVMDDLRAKGHGEDVLAKAREVTDATGAVIASGFTAGFDALDAVRDKYGEEPWFADVGGEFSGDIVSIPAYAPQWLVRAIGRQHDVGTSWNYDPLPVLQNLAVPQLWVIAEDDREAPNVETLRRIRALQAQGRPIDLVVFPDTDHGMYEYAVEDGERVSLRYPDGYLRLLAEWIAGRELGTGYGSGRVEPRRVTMANAAAPAEAPDGEARQ